MTGGMYGADVAQLRTTAGDFDRTAQELDAIRTLLSSSVSRAPWRGTDAEQFRGEWNGGHARALTLAAQRLHDAATALRRNADAQEHTSAADGGALSGSGAGAGAGGGSGATAPASPPTSGGADAVRDWWEGLTDAQRDALIAADPSRWGNLDGIPLDDRVEANRLTAEDRLAQGGLSAEERAYLEAVVAGDRDLVLYDPEAERIIEMFGTPGAQTTDVLVYVPGTDAAMDDFFGGTVQQVGAYLTDRDRSGGTVAFVYKDGPWAEWNPLSDRSNASEDFALGRGAAVADFVSAAQGDPAFRQVETTAIAHSAGMSVVSGSEVAGAQYDNVLSLGGSWLAPGWQADPSTNYNHYQYGIDAINYLDPFKDTPHESSAFSQHVFQPDTFEILGVTFQNEGENHVRIADGARTNQDALNEMYRDIHR